MSAGLTRQSLRTHPWSFVGPWVTLTSGAALVSCGVTLAVSVSAPNLTPPVLQALQDTGTSDFTTVFALLGVYLTVLIVGVTMSSTIARQGRDIALLRIIGATPAAVRRSAAAQAALVAVPAGLCGVPLGQSGAALWLSMMGRRGVIPTIPAHHTVWAWPAGCGAALGAAVLGAWVAAIRPARVRPVVALAETQVTRRGPGPLRTILGVLLVTGGVGMSVVVAGPAADQADNLGLLIVLAMCIGAGLLGPVLLRMLAPLARLFGPGGLIAADNVMVRATSLSGALVPLLLAVGFTAIKVAAHTTQAHLTGIADPDAWFDYSGTAIYAGFATLAAVNTLVAVTVGRRAEFAALTLAGATRRQILAVLIYESVAITAAVLLAAAGIAATTLVPLLHAELGVWTPYIPSGMVGVGVLIVFGLICGSTVATAAALLRRPAIELVAAEL